MRVYEGQSKRGLLPDTAQSRVAQIVYLVRHLKVQGVQYTIRERRKSGSQTAIGSCREEGVFPRTLNRCLRSDKG
jgi:hypothetical protein